MPTSLLSMSKARHPAGSRKGGQFKRSQMPDIPTVDMSQMPAASILSVCGDEERSREERSDTEIREGAVSGDRDDIREWRNRILRKFDVHGKWRPPTNDLWPEYIATSDAIDEACRYARASEDEQPPLLMDMKLQKAEHALELYKAGVRKFRAQQREFAKEEADMRRGSYGRRRRSGLY